LGAAPPKAALPSSEKSRGRRSPRGRRRVSGPVARARTPPSTSTNEMAVTCTSRRSSPPDESSMMAAAHAPRGPAGGDGPTPPKPASTTRARGAAAEAGGAEAEATALACIAAVPDEALRALHGPSTTANTTDARRTRRRVYARPAETPLAGDTIEDRNGLAATAENGHPLDGGGDQARVTARRSRPPPATTTLRRSSPPREAPAAAAGRAASNRRSAPSIRSPDPPSSRRPTCP